MATRAENGVDALSLLPQEVIGSSGAVVGYTYDPVDELTCSLSLKVLTRIQSGHVFNA